MYSESYIYLIQNTSRSLICEMLDKNSVLNCREMYVMLKLDVWGDLATCYSTLITISHSYWTVVL